MNFFSPSWGPESSVSGVLSISFLFLEGLGSTDEPVESKFPDTFDFEVSRKETYKNKGKC